MKQELEKIAREFDIPIADPYGLLALGAFLGQREEEKNKELGIYALKEFLKSKPDSPSGWHNLGVIYLSMGDAEKALGYLQKAYKLASGDRRPSWLWLTHIRNWVNIKKPCIITTKLWRIRPAM